MSPRVTVELDKKWYAGEWKMLYIERLESGGYRLKLMKVHRSKRREFPYNEKFPVFEELLEAMDREFGFKALYMTKYTMACDGYINDWREEYETLVKFMRKKYNLRRSKSELKQLMLESFGVGAYAKAEGVKS